MAIERAVGGSSLVEVLDRVLDKGIVIDAWVRLSLVGIELVTVEARVVIASVETYIKYADAIVGAPQSARPKAIEAGPNYAEIAQQLTQQLANLREQLAAPVRAIAERAKAAPARPRKAPALGKAPVLA
jgi:hypothetical protein